jgi:rubrerythrin
MSFDEEAATRAAMVRATHPLMKNKELAPTRKLIPVDQAIAQIREAIECYEGRLGQLYAELKILRDET